MTNKVLEKDATVFARSENPRELVDMARVYAASDDPADQEVVLGQLTSAGYLTRVNTESEYVSLEPRALDVARVIKTLMDQSHPAAVETLVRLTTSETFQSFYPLVELNVIGVAAERPAGERTLAYWDLHSHPESSNVDLVIEAIFRNKSVPAFDLFERKLNDPAHDDMRKSAWLREFLLENRNDPEVLKFCGRALTRNTLAEAWHNAVLEVLFDYNESWYLACEVPRPPPRAEMSPEARDLLGRIGEWAIRGEHILIPGLGLKTKRVMREIGYDWQDDDQT